jgi:hypothetical protein
MMNFDYSRGLWYHINEAFSLPVTNSDDKADYAPTQVLGEAFKSKHFDGIRYGSKVGDGSTIALFDPTATSVVSRCVCSVLSRPLTLANLDNIAYEPNHPSPSYQDTFFHEVDDDDASESL